MTSKSRWALVGTLVAALCAAGQKTPARAEQCKGQRCDGARRDQGSTLKNQVLNGCRYAEPDLGFYEWKSVAEWVEWADAYQTNMATLRAYVSDHPCCVSGSGGANPSEIDTHFVGLCEAADPARATTAGAAVTAGLETLVKEEAMGWVKRFVKPEARVGGDWNRIQYTYKRVLELAQTLPPTSGLDQARIKAVVDEIDGALEQSLVARDQSMADRVCPKPGHADKKLQSHLAKLLRAGMVESARTSKIGMVETLAELVLTGKPQTKRLALQRTTVESVGAVMCVHQAVPKQRDECRAIKITYERTKVDGQKWNEWRFAGVGDGFVMPCKNLKLK